MRYLFAILLLVAPLAPAAEIIRFTPGETNFLAIAKDKSFTVDLNQNLCLYQQKKQVACGIVIRYSEKGYILALDSIDPDAQLGPGNRVEIRRAGRNTAAQSSKLDIVQTSYETETTLKTVLGGLNILSPFARFEQQLLSWLNLGVMPTYLLNVSSGEGSLSGFGVFATASAYPMEPLNKLWGMCGLGGFFATGKANGVSDSLLIAGGFASAGWRLRFGDNMTAAAGVGAQTYVIPTTSVVSSSLGGVAPFVTLDFGLIF